MNEDRRKILEMLAQGKITADEAERLIAALEKEPARPTSSGSPDPAPKAKPKYLRVLVESHEPANADSPSLVNVRVPMQLLRAGVRLASLIPPQARDHVNGALRENGVPVDISQIRPENLEEIVDQLDDLTVDVDQKNDKVKVKVYCE
ncbi:MAG TPA: hypothetical protein VMJ34_06260 [Bryobacteraceae bacterium]|nr:hypothetical protein [Bryobacteraceae bacterium]